MVDEFVINEGFSFESDLFLIFQLEYEEADNYYAMKILPKYLERIYDHAVLSKRKRELNEMAETFTRCVDGLAVIFGCIQALVVPMWSLLVKVPH